MTDRMRRALAASLQFVAILGVSLAAWLPHAYRMTGDHAAFVDGIYPHGAWMLAQGYEPYVHFTHVAMLPADALLALLIDTFGAQTRVLEFATTMVIVLVGLLLGAAVKVSAGRVAAAATFLLWMTSTWVLHFHLFERETWAALGIAGALAALARHLPRDGGEARALTWRAAVLVALALAAAVAVKITTVFTAAGLCVFLALTGRRADALRVGIAYTAWVAALVGAHVALYGEPFVQQVFLFGFFRHGDASVADKLVHLASHGDHVLVLGAVGLAVAALRRPRGLAGAAAVMLGADLVYLVVVSPTVWDHNMIQPAVTCAVLGGLGVAELLGSRRAAVGGVAVAAVVVAGIAFAPPLPDVYGEPGPGFGGTPRAAIGRQVRFMQRNSPPGGVVVCADPWPAFLAERPCFVRYWDLHPVMVGLVKSVEADGYAATFAKRDGQLVLGAGRPEPPPRVDKLPPYAGRLLANAIVHVRPVLLEALAAREITLVVEPFAPGVLAPDDLRAAGYERFEDLGLAGWRPADGVVDTRVRTLAEMR